jgi:hypothetical protein
MIKLKLDLAKMTKVKVVKGTKPRPDGRFGTFLDITDARLFVGKTNDEGHTPYYLDLVMMEKRASQFGDWRDDQTHMIIEDTKKEEREQGIKGAILGNASDSGGRRTNDRAPAGTPVSAPPASPIDPDDVPF